MQLRKQAASFGAHHDGVGNKEHGNLIFQRGPRGVCKENEEKLVRNYRTNFFSEVCRAATNTYVHADFSLATKDSDMKEEERGGGGKRKKRKKNIVRFFYRLRFSGHADKVIKSAIKLSTQPITTWAGM